MFSLPRFGSSTSFALYYKRVLQCIMNPRISREIIQVIVNLVGPATHELILYKGCYNYSFLNASFSDIVSHYDLDVCIICNEISPFIEDHSLPQLLSNNDLNGDLEIIISSNATNQYFTFVEYFIKSLLSSPLLIDSNLKIMASNASTCHHPLYWMGRNAANCTLNTSHSEYCQSFKYFQEFVHFAFYKSIKEIQNLLLCVYDLHISQKHIAVSVPNHNQNDIANNHLITRQFHDCIFDKLTQQILIFGGYGTSKSMLNRKKNNNKSSKLPRARLNDTICLKYDNSNSLIYKHHTFCAYTDIPKARQHHKMVIVEHKNKSFIFMFGGRSNPHKAFNDFWLYDIANHEWMQLKTDNAQNMPCARYRHSMCCIAQNKVVLFGGICIANKAQKLLNDMYVVSIDFDCLSVGIECIQYEKDKNVPIPRCSMTVECINDSLLFSNEMIDKILVFGGLLSLNCCDAMMDDSDIYIFDLHTYKWDILETFNNGPMGLYGHSYCITEDKDNVIMCGGVMSEYNPFLDTNEIRYNANVWKLQISKRLWHCYALKEEELNIGHAVIYVERTDKCDILWLIGGGINVFSFGSVHSCVVELCLPY